jgi:hypothetical protein
MSRNIKQYSSLAAVVAALSGTAQASELKTAEDLAKYMRNSNVEYFESHPEDSRKPDWDKFVEIMNAGEPVVIKQDRNGKTYFGLDGWGQVLDREYQQLSTKNGKLDLSERIPNYSIPYEKGTKPVDAHYAWDGLPLLPSSDPDELLIIVPTVPYAVPGPEREVSPGQISVGTGFLHIFTQPDEAYNFDGQLFGGKAGLTFQPRQTNWYFGPEVMAYGNSSSAEQNVTVPAVDGPLAGQLVMVGNAQRSLFNIGLGVGFTGGYMLENDDHFGIGFELQSGFMLDFVVRELIENSTNYVNGVPLEGTSISNTTNPDGLEMKPNVFNGVGIRGKFDQFCITPAFGLRTNFSNADRPVDPMYSVTLGYCADRENKE